MPRTPESTQQDTEEPDRRNPWEAYAPDADRPPLASYATIAGGFSCGLATFLVIRRQQAGGLPERVALQDIGVVAGASFALSRLLTKKKVTAFLRAPFTEYEGKGDAPGELEERPRGSGPKRAIGELLTCPYCLDMWAATAGIIGLVLVPRETRVVTSILAAFGLSDLFQGVYRKSIGG
ncbi:MAG: DUF1360 domain-containing protein [Thermoleophilaceae bacterium]